VSDTTGIEPRTPLQSGSITLGGDVTGAGNATTVVGIQGRPVSSAAPNVGDVLTWNGTDWAPAAASATLETSGSALAGGTSVYRNGSDQMLAETGTYATLKDAFAGFTTTVAASSSQPVAVAGNGARATGLSGLTVGSGYYVSAGVLISESGLASWLGTATSGSWYRFVGTADTAISIKQAWGEPQQVP
jgi:hypothetical protein